VISWNPPNSGETPARYLIYNDAALTSLIGIVDGASELEFIDYLKSCKKVQYTYYIVSEDAVGSLSTPLIVTLNN
jgi:hypothetical protein